MKSRVGIMIGITLLVISTWIVGTTLSANDTVSSSAQTTSGTKSKKVIPPRDDMIFHLIPRVQSGSAISLR